MATILPNGKTQFVDQNGKPLAGGTVTFYAPGTTTKQDTWQDQAQSQVNTNPVVLDSRGQASIWGVGSYRQVVADKLGAVVWDQVVSEISAPLSGSTGASLVGFLQAGAGAVNRTMQAKGRDWVSLTDFGAAGDGATDDTAAFIAALATGKRVIMPMPSVSYTLSAGITVNRSLEGDGWNIATIKALNANARITVNSLGQLRNFRFDANNLATLAISAGVGQNRIFMKDVRVDNCMGDSFQLVNTQNSVLQDCQANNFTGNGFRITGAENCGLNNCNTNQNTVSSTASRGILMEAYNNTPPRNIKIKDGIYERGSSSYQVEILSAAGFISFINTEISTPSGNLAGIRWAARTDSTPASNGTLRLTIDAFTLAGTNVAVDGSASNIEFFVNGYIMSGTSGNSPLSLLLGKAKVHETRARTWFESSFEQDAESWIPSGSGSLSYNAANQTIDCGSGNINVGVRIAPGTFSSQFSMTGRWALLNVLVTALSGAANLAVGTTTNTGGRYNLAQLTVGWNRIAFQLQSGDTGIIIGAGSAVATTFSLRWVKADVL
ncbi:TPA: hypothetical protein SAO52_003658 [Burkholderia vietnamiensis]|nr:hypothetical protein [Burkholderia vietnamiensis]